jgi:long-chain fatty acid transport protein
MPSGICSFQKKNMKTMNQTKYVGKDFNRAMCSLVALAIIVGLLMFIALPAGAEGFRNSPPGAFNLGRAGGRIAQIDDSSAVQQNPANLTDVTNMEFQVTPSIIYYNAEFKSVTGQKSQTKDPWKFLPNAFVSVPFADGKAAVGLGITVPYGIGVRWDTGSSAFADPNGVLRYQTPYFAQLTTINLNPTVAFKIGDHLKIGAGFDAMWSQLTLKQFYPWFVFPDSGGTEPDGRMQADGCGWGFGGNVGVTWQITKRQRLAVTYRSPMDVHYDGKFEVNNITPTAAYLGVVPKTGFSSDIHFPTIVSAGYGIDLTEKIRVEADVEWLEFSRFQSLKLNIGPDGVMLPTTTINEKWHDTFTAGIGGDWKFAENWVLRAGYQFYQTPVPNSTFSPTIPDADQNVLTVGLGYTHKRQSFEIAYGLDFYADRNITTDQNPALNGKYGITVHLFSFAYRLSF